MIKAVLVRTNMATVREVFHLNILTLLNPSGNCCWTDAHTVDDGATCTVTRHQYGPGIEPCG